MTKKLPKPKKSNKKKQADPIDDAALWGHVTTGIKPLDRRHKNLLTLADGPAVTVPPPPRQPRTATTAPAAPPRPVKKPVALPDLDHSSSPGLDKSTAAKLKKGRQPIEGRLDLHGMTQSEAHPALDSFIDNAYRAGKRGVLVITGKGTKLDGSVGVLRQAVPRWLNLPPNRPRILAFSHATAKDGGEGALYVLLKRKR